MYTVMLIDDEPWELLGMERMFDWNKWGFEVTGRFGDAVEALSAILKDSPDVVFTDIRMPEVSGIDIMKEARAHGLHTEFVIVSGYAEFTYAQAALGMGAFAYKLKPLIPTDSDELLEKLSQQLLKASIVRDGEYYEQLIDRNNHSELLLRNLGLCSNELFVVITEHPMGLQLPFCGLALRLSDQKTIYLLEKAVDIDALRVWHAALPRLTREAVTIGVSSLGVPGNARRLIREAQNASQSRFLYESSGVFQSHPEPDIRLLVESITDAAKMRDVPKLQNLLSSATDRFIELGAGISSVELLGERIQQVVSEMPGGAVVFEMLHGENIIREYDSARIFFQYLSDMISLFLQGGASHLETAQVRVCFMRLLEEVDKNYTKPLSIGELSKKYYINTSYCCELFRKVTGKTFSQYIAELRLARAADSIVNSNLSIVDISCEVGYNDYCHFNRMFKRLYTVSPQRYRDLNRQKTASIC